MSMTQHHTTIVRYCTKQATSKKAACASKPCVLTVGVKVNAVCIDIDTLGQSLVTRLTLPSALAHQTQ